MTGIDSNRPSTRKVSAELNRPFAIRGDLGVVWERQKQETGWRSWVPWPHVHAEDIILGNPPAIAPEVTMVHLPRVEATLASLALLTKTVWLPWIKLEKPDARLIRLSEKNNNWTFNLANDERNKDECKAVEHGRFGWIIFSSIKRDGSPLMTK
ncbi:AsmA family protein [Escherichia coli]|nr:AsmA family protein [Escherichia coli]